MIVSHSHHFVFVHIQKTGGTSLTKILHPYAADQRDDEPQYFQRNHHRDGELHTRLAKGEYPGYFKFCFVRDPFDRILSWRRRGCVSWLPPMKPMTRFVDHVARFENYEEEVRGICRRIGVPCPAKLPHLLDTSKVRDKEVTEELLAEIRRRYAGDFEAFGYDPHRKIEIR